jgi:hypothetical protein
VTALASCEEAVTMGRGLAVQVELATGVDTPAADIALGAVCMAIQGDSPKTGAAEDLELAKLVNGSGVCPGNLNLLSRS